MAKQLVEFPLEDGGSILVEVEHPAGREVMRGMRPKVEIEKAQQTFDEATRRSIPALQRLISHLQGLSPAPESVAIEFGLQFTAEAGAFVASVSGEASFKVSLSWRST
jgi:hypothetical protein